MFNLMKKRAQVSPAEQTDIDNKMTTLFFVNYRQMHNTLVTSDIPKRFELYKVFLTFLSIL
jgi:hypothetical protein